MRKVLFIRHAEPIKTTEHHSKWEINPADCQNIDIDDIFDHYLCSHLMRSIMTGEAIFPHEAFQKHECLNEIEKGIEANDAFEIRVRAAFEKVIFPLQGNIFIASHGRFMRVASKIFLGKDRKFNYLETMEINAAFSS